MLVPCRRAAGPPVGKCTINRHNPKTPRKEVGATYRGCLVVCVGNSADLNLQIAGWCEGIAAAAELSTAG
jgi:hypothetical protein